MKSFHSRTLRVYPQGGHSRTFQLEGMKFCSGGLAPRWTKATRSETEHKVTKCQWRVPDLSLTVNIKSCPDLVFGEFWRLTATKRATRASPVPAQCPKCHAWHASEGGCRQVPRLPRKWNVDVANAAQNEGGCHQAPRLPGKVPRRRGCRQVPRLPRKVPRRHGQPAATKRATRPSRCHKCHACHAKTKANASKVPCLDAKRQWMSPSATPGTQSPTASRVTNDNHRQPSTPPDPAQCHNCHACHAKRRWVRASATATPAMQTAAASPLSSDAQARYQSQPSALSAAPATQSEGGCRQVPCRPRKVKVDDNVACK